MFTIHLEEVVYFLGTIIHALNQRLCGDALVVDGKRLKYGQLFVRIALILNGTAHGNVLISVCPILRYALCESLNALGQKEKGAV